MPSEEWVSPKVRWTGDDYGDLERYADELDEFAQRLLDENERLRKDLYIIHEEP